MIHTLNHNKNFNLDIKFQIPLSFEILLPATVWLTVFKFATTYDLINLAHTSEHLRSLVLFKFQIYFEWANGFCDSK